MQFIKVLDRAITLGTAKGLDVGLGFGTSEDSNGLYDKSIEALFHT